MSRFAHALALTISILALVLAIISLARRQAEVDPTNSPASTGISVPPPAAEGTVLQPGMSSSEVAAIAAEIVATRDREIVDRIWPQIVRIRERMGRKVPSKPTKLDDALSTLFDFEDESDETEVARSPKSSPEVTHCKNNLKQLGVYFALFESTHRCYPASIDDLRKPDLITPESTILICPFDKSGDSCSYEYLHPILGDGEPPDMIMAYDRRSHPDGKRCVLYFQGRVEEVSDSDFQGALAEQIANDRVHLGEEIVKARAAVLDPALREAQKEEAAKRLSILEGLNR